MAREQSMSPLRVVYLTQSPGDFTLDAPAYALAYTLREHGDAYLIGVGHLPLPLVDIAEAERYGIEQVYLPLAGWNETAKIAGWRALLRRFQPDIIHIGSDMPTASAHKLAQTLRLSRRAIIVIEDLDQLPQLTSRREARWHPMLYTAAGMARLNGWHQRVPAPAISVAAADAIFDELGDTAKKATGTAVAGAAQLSFVGLLDPTDPQAVVDFARALLPIVDAHRALHCTLLARESLVKRWHKEMMGKQVPYITLVSSEAQWQREALFAIGALGSPAHAVSLSMLGTALALNRSAIVADARLAHSPLAHAPRIKLVQPGDATAFLNQVSALVIQHAYHTADGATLYHSPTAREIAQQQRWMYYGLKLRARTQKGEGTV